VLNISKIYITRL